MYEIFEKLLKEHGVTAYRVAKETGVTTATLTSWKQGKYTPKPEKNAENSGLFRGVSYLFNDWKEGNRKRTKAQTKGSKGYQRNPRQYRATAQAGRTHV